MGDLLSHALSPRGWLRYPSEARSTREDALSDQALVDAIVHRGSQRHFSTLIARHKTRVHHIALSVLGPGRQAAAEDVAQEVFIRLHDRLASFRGDSSFSTWLYRMAFNQAIDHQRRQRRHEGVPLDGLKEPGFAERADDDAVRSAIRTAVEQLGRTQRIMVHLHYWMGYRIREIAEILGCPEGTVKVYLARARNQLASALDGLEGELGND